MLCQQVIRIARLPVGPGDHHVRPARLKLVMPGLLVNVPAPADTTFNVPLTVRLFVSQASPVAGGGRHDVLNAPP